ncbi:MAG TPA: nucleotidyltransferase family protein [Solirubrobacteraceae bacterium]|nr:nucleotidyltransferase family protein [Solirubrobacteraceae bacterium]
MTVAGVVLAAGAGRRFGSLKQVAELDGAPLLQHAVDAMLAVPALDPVLVVLGAQAERVRAAVRLERARVAVCEGWEEGLAASLRCGAQAAGDADWIVVTLGDQPFITPQVIAMVLDEAVAGPGTLAVRATYSGEPGHPVALGRALLPAVMELRGDAGARDLLTGPGVKMVEAGHLCRPDDVDVPDQLEALRP